MTFPIRLEPFEEYMLIESQLTDKMSFYLNFTFSGHCDSEHLERALQISLKRHPVLNAKVVETKKNRYEWFQCDPKCVSVKWMSGDDAIPERPIDLFSGPGIRLFAQKSGEKTEIVCQFHHSSCDALGAMRFIEDLLVAYSGLNKAASTLSFRPIDQRLTRLRPFFMTLAAWRQSTQFEPYSTMTSSK